VNKLLLKKSIFPRVKDLFRSSIVIRVGDPMVKSVEKILIELGADKGKIVVEQV